MLLHIKFYKEWVEMRQISTHVLVKLEFAMAKLHVHKTICRKRFSEKKLVAFTKAQY